MQFRIPHICCGNTFVLTQLFTKESRPHLAGQKLHGLQIKGFKRDEIDEVFQNNHLKKSSQLKKYDLDKQKQKSLTGLKYYFKTTCGS